ncbi:Dyggve-Melchior-Clausen syndrome protein [Carex littledalei]|uniref:Dymeclin n=1 Tax=Carex littledalei TaxID=544730 RepID=A0A833QTJ9_9POAL|nr:Dyggve-Melchior-Clausen syndrome protein [Carex littledalei]
MYNSEIGRDNTRICYGSGAVDSTVTRTKDMHPFLDAAMLQESDIVTSVVRRLLLNFITRPHVPFNGSSYPVFSDNGEPGVLQRVGSAAGYQYLTITAEFAMLFDLFT